VTQKLKIMQQTFASKMKHKPVKQSPVPENIQFILVVNSNVSNNISTSIIIFPKGVKN